MGIIKILRALKNSFKVDELVDAFYLKGAFNFDEREALGVITSHYYFNNIREEKDLVELLKKEYDCLHHPINIHRESLKKQRRVVIRLLLPEFRRRMFDFCLGYLIPFAEKTKFSDLIGYSDKCRYEAKHKA